jgi:hypothetical protein
LAERIEQELLPLLNIATLVIPVLAMAMQLGSAAAGLVAATEPTDVAQLDTPARARAEPEPRAVPLPRSDAGASEGVASESNSSMGDRSPSASPWSSDPLLGYGL